MRARAWQLLVMSLLALTALGWTDAVGAGTRATSEAPTASRRDPAELLELAPTEDELPDHLLNYREPLRPGDVTTFPPGIIDELMRSRRFVRGATFGYESVDGTLPVDVAVMDLGDPRVLETVDLEEWDDPLGDGFPSTAVTRPDRFPDDRYAELDVTWTRGPLLFVVIHGNLSQARSVDELRSLAAVVVGAIDSDAPDLPVVEPVRPATAVDEALALGTGIAPRALTILLLRWAWTWVMDPAAKRRLWAHVDQEFGRPPPPASPFLHDVTRPANTYLWVTRALGVIQVVAFVGFLSVAASTYVLLDAGSTAGVGWLVATLVVAAALWLVSPRLARGLCGAFTRGAYRPPPAGGRSRHTRWVAAPAATVVALVGMLLSAALAAGGLALVIRAVAVVATGARGATDPALAERAEEGYLMLAAVLLAASAVPYTVGRRAAQRSEDIAWGNDERPPILLLRSFADDRLRMRAHRTARQHPLTRLRANARDRFEEIVTWTLGREGPVTALSQPGSRLQPLGAARQHYADIDWKDAVKHLIRKSSLIVLIIDDTEAVRDEIRMVRAAGALDRTLFVVPPVAARERRKRLRWFEDVLGTGRELSRLDRTTAVLLAQVGPDGQVRATTARFREDLAYEVALDLAMGQALDPQTAVVAPGPQTLDHPAPRRGRRERLSMLGWTLSLTLAAFTGAIERIVPPIPLHDARPADEVLDVPMHMAQFTASDGRHLGVPVARTLFLVATGGGEGWEHTVGPDDRIRDVALGPSVVAMSTYENATLHLFDAADGHERASVDLHEPTGALAVTDQYVLAVRTRAAQLVVLGLDGTVVAEVPLSGLPTYVAADEERAVVYGARTSVLDVIDLVDMSSSTVEVGEGVRGLGFDGDTAYASRPDAQELLTVDLAAGVVSERLPIPHLAQGLSHNVSGVAVGPRYVAVPLYEPPGSAGIAVVDRKRHTVADRWWLGLLGPPSELFVYGDVVHTGFIDADGVHSWTPRPARFVVGGSE